MHSILLSCMLTVMAWTLRPASTLSVDIGQIKSQLALQRLSANNLQRKIIEEQKPTPGCFGCLEIKKNTREYEIYLEYIKADILAKLGMKERPRRGFSQSQIPAPVYDGKLLSMDEFGSSNSKPHNQIIIIGEKADKTACPAQDCFLFRLKRKAFMKAGIVDSLQLWVYKLKDGVKQGASSRLRVSVAMIKRHNLLSTNVEERQDLLISMTHQGEAGWLGMDSANAKDWIKRLQPRQDDIDLFLSLQCHGWVVARKGDKRPFLVINVQNEAKKRNRRVIGCQPSNGDCCRESLFVNFTEIGWNDWIVEPKGYHVNYCRGQCNSLSIPTHGYITVVQKLIDKKVCCSPKSYTAITILYRDEKVHNNMYKKVLPNMSVDECACS